MTPIRLLAASAVLTALPALANAHELWIDPLAFQVDPGTPITADIRVGQEFEGSAHSYLPNGFRRFDLVSGDSVVPVEGRLGDRPALNQESAKGLAVAVYVTKDNRLTYQTFDKFEAFVRHKDALWTVDAHAARGLPTEDFVELYSRYAKSLVAVGDGAGSDREVGLLTELVALANPYTDDLGEQFPVKVIYQGAPRAEAQVEIFEKAPDGSVTVNTVRSGADGVAFVPVKPGHAYQLDAVVLREPTAEAAERTRAVWESLWANLTFAVPAK